MQHIDLPSANLDAFDFASSASAGESRLKSRSHVVQPHDTSRSFRSQASAEGSEHNVFRCMLVQGVLCRPAPIRGVGSSLRTRCVPSDLGPLCRTPAEPQRRLHRRVEKIDDEGIVDDATDARGSDSPWHRQTARPRQSRYVQRRPAGVARRVAANFILTQRQPSSWTQPASCSRSCGSE